MDKTVSAIENLLSDEILNQLTYNEYGHHAYACEDILVAYTHAYKLSLVKYNGIKIHIYTSATIYQYIFKLVEIHVYYVTPENF